MTGFLFLVVLVLFIYLVIRNGEYSRSFREMRTRITELEKKLTDQEFKNAVRRLETRQEEAPAAVAPKAPEQTTPPKTSELPKLQVAEEVKPIPSQAPPQPIQQTPPKINVPPGSIAKPAPKVAEPVYQVQQPRPPVPPRVPKPPSEFWTKVEKQFIENWTGILGAVIMVAGVIFMGVYAAVKMSAFYRFLLITGFAALLAGMFFYLKRKEKWVKFALWLRSSAGAVFLFGCLGSAGIPGLQWVHDPLQCVLILDLGIIVNIYLGYLGGMQVYASLHVVLSLVALSIAPPESLTLVTAAIVTLCGVALTYKEKWNYHLLLTISSFFAYHLYWFFQQHEVTTSIKIVGITTVIVISVAVALVHYRKAYQTKTFDALPFSVHLVNWLYFGMGLFLYSSGMKISTIFIAAGAIAAFFLARKARKLEIPWLYYTDTLTAQGAAIIALLSLRNWNIDGMFIASAVFIQVLLYLVIMVIEKQDFLYRVGMFLANITGVLLFLYALGISLDNKDVTSLYMHSTELFFCFFGGMAFILKSPEKQKLEVELFTFFGALMGALIIALDVYLYEIGSQLSTGLIFGLAIFTYLTGRASRSQGTKWLYQMLALVAQGGVILGFYTLNNWGADNLLILSEMFAELIVFQLLMIFEKDDLLYTIGGFALYFISVLLLAVSFLNINYADTTILYRHVADLAACLILGSVFILYAPKKKDLGEGMYIGFGAVLGIMFIAIYVDMYYHNWIEYAMTLIAITLLFIKEKWRSEELGIAALISMVASHFICWYFLYMNYSHLSGTNLLLHGLPLFVLAGLGAIWSGYFKIYLNWIGIYFFAITAVGLSYLVFNPISPFIPAVIWLGMSLIALELAHFFGKRLTQAQAYKNQTDRFLLHVGYALIVAFLARHILVHLQSDQYIGSFIKIRFLIELFAFGVFIYWASAKNPPASKYRSWRILHPLFIELIIAFFILTVSVETTVYWYPIIWIIAAFVMGILGNLGIESLSRLKFNSLLMYWTSAFQVAFVTSSYVTPSLAWYAQASYSGSVTILLQFAFLVYFYKKCKLDTIVFPQPLKFLAEPAKALEKKRNNWIFFPIILCAALFLFFSFDKSILTLLWVIECFLVFILSVILKEKYFRYISLGAIVICILRLIFYDLAQTSALTRAFVFFGVGIIMLIMNAIYNKYKARFD